ncbi:MAG: hypothetical protein Q7S58_01695 [Candidatus Binatus sp.]|uniref:hypothetical protein n=1 Tax=Candidatus Binatus sp. TaxID=2811406 RepID=UPI00271A904A|nr:hypothetical protein [Candidatus Binatus sp.]MDO8431103.1 hypothetical protein [Candidatus Binatus sp.]
MGKFRGFRELKEKVCKACNNRFGTELEDVFLHCGPEALFREIAGGNLGRETHEKHNIFARGAKKHPPVQVLGEDPDAKRAIMLEVGSNSEAKPQRQVVIIGQQGEVELIRLGAEACRFPPHVPGLLRERHETGYRVEQFFGDSDEDLRLSDAMCSEIFGRRPVVFRSGEPGQIIRARSAFQLTSTYFRAIAKIGFHAFLHFYPNFTGFEPEFNAIKQFIYNGEEPNSHVLASPDLIIRSGEFKAPAHAVACDWNQHSLEARIQLFAGLESGMQVVAGTEGGHEIATRQGDLVWAVRLGANPSRLVFEDRRGVVLSYFKQQERGFHGETIELRSGKALPIARLLGAM